MKVSDSADFLESIANHPRVIRAIGCTAESFVAGDSWNASIGLEWPTGGIVFVRESPGVYSAHLVFAPKTKEVIGKCRAALRYMFTKTPAHTITGKIPLTLRHARKVATAAGMQHLFDCDGQAYYRLTAREWIKHKEAN